jgi:hypothetical protein
MAAQQNLLQIAQAVVDELGLPAITSVIGNMTTTARQILALANRAGDELYQTHQWTASQNLNVINIQTPVYIGDAITVAGSNNAILTTNAGIIPNAFAVTGIQIPTAARVTAVNIDGVTITMDEPSAFTGSSPVVIARDTFDIPADFKWFLNRTMWDRTNHWELIGPISPQVDEWQRSGIVTVGPRKRWRQVGLPNTCWRIWPPPTATTDYPSTLVFEYESAFWVLGVDGITRQATFQADGDTPIVDSQAIVLTIKWRLWQIKGFEYGAMQAEANDYISRLAARDGGSADLTLGRRANVDDYLISPWSAPDSFPAS